MTLKQNMTKYKLIEAHLQEVRKGNYEVAKRILRLLQRHHIRVGLDDIEAQVEFIAEDAGCRVAYTRNYYTAIIRF